MYFGKLQVSSGVSSLDPSGDRLARCAFAGDPLAEATRFLREDCRLEPGDMIEVDGSIGSVGGQPVICVTDAKKSSGRSINRAFAAIRDSAPATARKRAR